MAKPEYYATRRVAVKATVAHQEHKRHLALRKAYVMKSGPLIEARCDEYESSGDIARDCHRGVEQTGALERPLHQGRDQRKSDPYKEIASSEPNGCSKRRALRVALSTHASVDEKHWRRRGRHHADHHHGPHSEYRRELHLPPGHVRRHHESHAGRNGPQPGHVHAAHVHADREPQQVAPRQGG